MEEENKDIANNPSNEENSQKKRSKKNNALLTWIIVVVGLIVVLTILVLIGLKIQKSKKSSEALPKPKEEINIELEDNNSEKEETKKPLSKKELIAEAFYYPNTIKEEASLDYDFIFYTNDSVVDAYSYYEELISLNNWNLGPSGMETNHQGGFFHVYQDDFNASLNIYALEGFERENGVTKIEIGIDYKEEGFLSSTFNKPPFSAPEIKKLPEEKSLDYILPFSSSRNVNQNDLLGLSEWQLKLARNEIYARHGRFFEHQDLNCYFAKLSWYQIDQNYNESSLSPLELSNAVFILNYEKEINSSLINKDTGCK